MRLKASSSENINTTSTAEVDEADTAYFCTLVSRQLELVTSM